MQTHAFPVCLQALEAARKLLRQREAQLAEAAAECDAAAGERGQLEQQMQAGRQAIEGEQQPE